MSIRNRLLAVLLGLSAVAAAILVASYVATEAETQAYRAASVQAFELVGQVDAYDAAISDEDVAVRSFLVSGEADPRTAYGLARAAVDRAAEDLTTVARDRPELAPSIGGLLTAGRAWQTDWADRSIYEYENYDSTFDLWGKDWTSVGAELLTAVRGELGQLRSRLGAPDAILEGRVADLDFARTVALAVGIVLIFVSAALADALLGRLVSRPLRRLVRAARKVEAGEAVSFVSDAGRTEISELGQALERMRVQLVGQQAAAAAEAADARIENRLTEVVTYVEDDARVSEALLAAFRDVAGADDAVVHLANASTDRAMPAATEGEAPAEPLALHALSTCPGIRRASTYLAADLADPLTVRCPAYQAETGTLACVPLMALGTLVGGAHLHWRNPTALEPRVIAVLGRISERTALSIANRRLVRALEGMAATDARTGLANIRAMDRAIERELEGLESGVEVAVLMLDLDHFKQLNDRYGHPAGDEALRSFAEILRSSVRAGDLAGRYGGEEFVALLPGLGGPAALEVAERIRLRTEATTLVLGPGVNARITVSIGVATAPANGRTRTELLRAADTALYGAKESGRNRSAVAGAVDGAVAGGSEASEVAS